MDNGKARGLSWNPSGLIANRGHINREKFRIFGTATPPRSYFGNGAEPYVCWKVHNSIPRHDACCQLPNNYRAQLCVPVYLHRSRRVDLPLYHLSQLLRVIPFSTSYSAP